MTIIKLMKKKPVAAGPRQSTRFSPSRITEKLIPILLALLVLALIAVLVIVGLSMLGITPSA